MATHVRFQMLQWLRDPEDHFGDDFHRQIAVTVLTF
jgi:hypothetical protein